MLEGADDTDAKFNIIVDTLRTHEESIEMLSSVQADITSIQAEMHADIGKIRESMAPLLDSIESISTATRRIFYAILGTGALAGALSAMLIFFEQIKTNF